MSALKKFLSDKGHTFVSQTDTEVLEMLIGHVYTEMKAHNHLPAETSLMQRAVQGAVHGDGRRARGR